MTIDFATREDILELKAMMQEILTLLKSKESANDEWVTAKGIKEMLQCSDSTLSNYRTLGLLPFTKHGGKYFYSKKVVNDILKGSMSMPVN